MKDLDALVKAKQAEGWSIEPTENNHLSWKAPNGNTVISGSTPSDWRAIENLKSRLRAAAQASVTAPDDLADDRTQSVKSPQPHLVAAKRDAIEQEELRELIREAHGVLKDLRAERKLSEDTLPTIVYAELTKPDGQLYELVTQAVDGFDKAGKASIAEYAAAMGILLRTAEKEIGKRTARFDELIARMELRGL